MTQISLLVGHAFICPVLGCKWMKPVVDRDEFTNHLKRHETREQAGVFDSLIEHLKTGESLLIGEAVLFQVK